MRKEEWELIDNGIREHLRELQQGSDKFLEQLRKQGFEHCVQEDLKKLQRLRQELQASNDRAADTAEDN